MPISKKEILAIVYNRLSFLSSFFGPLPECMLSWIPTALIPFLLSVCCWCPVKVQSYLVMTLTYKIKKLWTWCLRVSLRKTFSWNKNHRNRCRHKKKPWGPIKGMSLFSPLDIGHYAIHHSFSSPWSKVIPGFWTQFNNTSVWEIFYHII